VTVHASSTQLRIRPGATKRVVRFTNETTYSALLLLLPGWVYGILTSAVGYCVG
jgi:hypothetical protein